MTEHQEPLVARLLLLEGQIARVYQDIKEIKGLLLQQNGRLRSAEAWIAQAKGYLAGASTAGRSVWDVTKLVVAVLTGSMGTLLFAHFVLGG